jgi:hypothetical protein
VIVTVSRPVAKRQLVETGNPSACATVDCNLCGLAIVLHACNLVVITTSVVSNKSI